MVNNSTRNFTGDKKNYELLDKERVAELIALINRDFVRKENIQTNLGDLIERVAAIEEDNNLFHPALVWKTE